MNIDYEQFGDQRVMDTAQAVQRSGNHKPYEIITKMTTAVHQFVDKAEKSDDLTMLAIQYIKPLNPPA
jgi:sigma-B regulation protein RsbU (phosphoserine phosphatase)